MHEKEDAKSMLDGDVGVKDEINYDIYLVGKFIREMVVKLNATERALLAIWRLLKGTTIKPVRESGLYLIQFYHIIYLKKMIFGVLWSFNN